MFVALIVGVGVFVWGNLQATAADLAKANAKPLRDRFGDPLPRGAIHRFGTIRFRHAFIRNIAFTPDGKRLIVNSGSEPLAVFETATGRKLRTLGKFSADIFGSFAVSPDNKCVARCDLDITLWDLETGQVTRKLNSGNCSEVVFSPDGTKVAALWELHKANESPAGVTVMEVATGKCLVEWTIKKGDFLKFGLDHLAYSPGGKFLAVHYWEIRRDSPLEEEINISQIQLLNATTKTRLRTFDSPDVRFLSYTFQPNSGRLAAFGNDSIVRFWDVTTGKEVQRFSVGQDKKPNEKDRNDFAELQFSADGKRCAVWTDRCKFLTVLDAKDGRVVRRIEAAKSDKEAALAFSSDGRTIATARRYGESCVRVWGVASGIERLVNIGHRAVVTHLSLSADGRTLVSQDDEERLFHWDIKTSKGELRPTGKQEEDGRPIVTNRDGEWIIHGPRWRLVHKYSQPPKMEVWTKDGAKLIRRAKPFDGIGNWLLSPDGTHLAIATYSDDDSTLLLWNPERENKPRVLQRPFDGGTDLLFSHNGTRLTAAGGRIHDCRGLSIWDTVSARLIRRLMPHSVPDRVFFSADDSLLIASSKWNDAAVYAWNAETGRELAVLTDPSNRTIDGLALSPDERFLAVATSEDDASYLTIWETASWKPIRSFAPMRPKNRAKTMIFSRDVHSLFTAHFDTTILQWDVSAHRANGRHPLTDEKLNKDRLNDLWRMLAQSPDKAYGAVWEMLDHPAESVPFLIEHVSPVDPSQAKRVQRLIAQLDSDSFAERQEASRQLQKLGKPFLPMLHEALKARPSLETKRRLERIMDSLGRGLSSEALRRLRALAVLEWSATVEADKHLRRLADGVPSASFTQTAKAAWQRRKR